MKDGQECPSYVEKPFTALGRPAATFFEFRFQSMRFSYSSGSRPFSGYTIKRGIGVGGFGEVYFALNDAGKEVALKKMAANSWQKKMAGRIRKRQPRQQNRNRYPWREFLLRSRFSHCAVISQIS